ncbi:MAG: hypothetical protein HY608_04270, partial [Planctomycetes bacterium]|nr:hypothetical protein [Planctomycetota bacterium]
MILALALTPLAPRRATAHPPEEPAPPSTDAEIRPGDGVLLIGPDGSASWDTVAAVRERFPGTREKLPETLPPHVGAIAVPPQVLLLTDGWRGIAERLCRDYAAGDPAGMYVDAALQALPMPGREGLVEVAAGSAYARTEVRAAAVDLLGRLEGPDADAVLGRIALESPSRATRVLAVDRLAEGGRPVPARVLAAIGSEALPSSRALEVVRRTRDPAALPHVMTALRAHEDRAARTGMGLRHDGEGI